MSELLLPESKMPNWFTYPSDFVSAVEDGLLDVGPWQILTRTWLVVRLDGLRKRFPNRSLVPFARRLDNDDIACWQKGTGAKVYLIHDFAAPGWEAQEQYPSFKDWLAAARAEESDIENY